MNFVTHLKGLSSFNKRTVSSLIISREIISFLISLLNFWFQMTRYRYIRHGIFDHQCIDRKNSNVFSTLSLDYGNVTKHEVGKQPIKMEHCDSQVML